MIDEVDTGQVQPRDLTERTLVTAMAWNPLVALDPAQLLAAAGRVAARAIAHPRVLGSRTAAFVRELGKIATGTSACAPTSSDRRFADPAFREHPLYRRWMQFYLASREALLGLVDEIDLDTKSRLRGQFALSLVTEAMAPTNTLAGNPAALKRAFETGGGSLVHGLRNVAHDMLANGGLPSQVDRSAFRVGETLACSPGQVVFRSPILELIQYSPSTARVYQRPLLLIPPQINKYYVLDLAKGRSMVEFAVGQGFQVFGVSWRNPTPAQREWGLDAYVQALCDATDAVREVTSSDKLNVLAACAGGITTSVLLGHLAALGDERVASATFPVTVLDTAVDSLTFQLASEKTLAVALARSQKEGMMSGQQLARVFSWLRPNDLVWNYWVSNYLLGNAPPAFDILYWNNDYTNLPATLHAEFLEIFLKNSLVTPGALEVLSTPIDLGRVRADVYAVGALADHITPWEGCYRTPGLFGGQRTFVQSSGGHIQAIVNPIGGSKMSYRVNDAYEPAADLWLKGASEHKGSWWKHWAEWLAARSGPEGSAPGTLGNARHRPRQAAPGRYVLQQA
jgi:polyhydroxyalkanoate synthase